MKKWIKILLVVLSVVALSVGIFFTLKALGITSIEGIRELVAKCGAWGWIVFMVLFIICSVLLCFIPGTSATFIAVSIIMFGALKGFIISTVSVFLASSLMFWIGNTLGEKTAAKIVGKDSLEKAQNLLDVKSKMLLPLMFLFPVFPDDALCMVAGMTKMRYWYFAVVVAIFRTVGIATICFLGSGFIDWSQLKITDWFVLINVCVFDIFLIFKYQNKIEKFILRKKKTEMYVLTDEEVYGSANQKVSNITNVRLEGLLHHKEVLEESLAKHKKTIEEKKYCSGKQLANINKKIAHIEADIKRTTNQIEKLMKLIKLTKTTSAAQTEVQNIVSNQITEVMKNSFPSIDYEIKPSKTTTSVYLVLKNANGVEKTIRFSDHDTAKCMSKHNIKGSITKKSIKATIEKNLKVLNRKTVFVLLNKIQEDRRDNGTNNWRRRKRSWRAYKCDKWFLCFTRRPGKHKN